MALSNPVTNREVEAAGTRLQVLTWIAGVAFLGLVIRLYVLQIVRGEELSIRGQRNFVQEIIIPHDRGIVYDRYGRILVDNRPSLDVQVTPAFLGKKAEARESLTRLVDRLGLRHEDLMKMIQTVEARRRSEKFVPVIVARDLNPEQVEAIEEDRALFLLNGIEVIEGRKRFYPLGNVAAHLLGYVNEIDAAELKVERQNGNPRNYKLGDEVGRGGVEKTHEGELRGRDGFEQIVVDAKGRRLDETASHQLLPFERRVDPEPGHNVFLTIDVDLQQATDRAFDGKAGAVVVVDVKTGEVLTYASYPAFDPNLLGSVNAKDAKNRLDNDPLKPWLNRPIQGQYAPGSTFKVVTALAALQEKVTGYAEKVRCPGYYKMGNHVWRCHKDSGHGLVDLVDAIKVSCDTFFYTMAGRMGIEPIAKSARLLGLGRRSSIALSSEAAGIVPDEAFHNRVEQASGGYQKGMAINTAIGQGSLLVTPLQMAVMYAALANGGNVYAPQIVERVETADFRVTRQFLSSSMDEFAEVWQKFATESDGVVSALSDSQTFQESVEGESPVVTQNFAPRLHNAVPMTKEMLQALHAGLAAVVNDAGGTAYYRRSRNVVVAGKTGTAQVVRLGRERLEVEEMSYFERDHAWFVGYAPADDPKIAIAVLNEHSGHGGSKAAPIAMAVIDAYFNLEANRLARGD